MTSFLATWQTILQTFPSALIGGVVMAAVCAFIGIFVVLKRVVFIGATLSQVAACGITAALLCHIHPLLGATVFTLAAVTLLAFPVAETRIPGDAMMGLLFVLASALGILFVSSSGFGLEEVKALLYGNLILATPRDLDILLLGLVPIALVFLLFLRPIVYTLVDREEARVLGLNVLLWELLFFYVLGIVIAGSSKLGGMLLVFCYLVVPPMTALLITNRLVLAAIVSTALAVGSTVLGLYVSFAYDLPTNQVIAVISCALLVCCLIGRSLMSLRTRRGIPMARDIGAQKPSRRQPAARD